MNDKKDFEAALKGKKVPLLVLDQKWHRLFAIHGKTGTISILYQPCTEAAENNL